jgi:hypothetical protein
VNKTKTPKNKQCLFCGKKLRLPEIAAQVCHNKVSVYACEPCFEMNGAMQIMESAANEIN